MTMSKLLTYSELCQFDTYGDRLKYLRLWDIPHSSPRNISNSFYKSRYWMIARKEVITRDLGCDLGIITLPIDGRIIVHHMNPLQQSDIENWDDYMVDPEYLICVSEDTHNKIHYQQPDTYVERRPGDTKLW